MAADISPLSLPLSTGPDATASEVLERIDEGVYVIDREWRFLAVNRAAEEFWGKTRQDLLGRCMLDVFPRFPGSESYKAHQTAMAEGRPLLIETVSTATGAPVELKLYPGPGGLSVYFRDVSQRHRMERELRERDEILTLAEISSGIGVWDADLTSGTLRGTPQFFRLLGLEPRVEPVSMNITRGVRHPDDRERVVQGFREAIANGKDSYEVEYRIILPDGQVRWIFGRGRVIRDLSGTPVRYSGIDIVITERKRHEEQLSLVMRELLHRTNNMLAVIQAMAHQTAIRSAGLREFEERFGARLRGLAHSNELLVRQDWRGGTVVALVQAQLAPFVDAEGARLELDGPPVLLKPEAVQNLGLALHELATNASKYGALSRPEGRIGIKWRVDKRGSQPRRFHLSWREHGGPPVRSSRRKGFGRFVVETMVARSLEAEVSIDFAAGGLSWTISIPEGHALARDGD